MKDRFRILFVTPTSSEREHLASLMDDLKAQVTYVDTPAEAIHQLRSGLRFDVVFMGISVPGEEHCPVLTAVQQSDPSTAVVLLSHIDDVGFYLECLRQGVFDYIPRPVDWKEFRRIYHLALDRRARTRSNSYAA